MNQLSAKKVPVMGEKKKIKMLKKININRITPAYLLNRLQTCQVEKKLTHPAATGISWLKKEIT